MLPVPKVDSWGHLVSSIRPRLPVGSILATGIGAALIHERRQHPVWPKHLAKQPLTGASPAAE